MNPNAVDVGLPHEVTDAERAAVVELIADRDPPGADTILTALGLTEEPADA